MKYFNWLLLLLITFAVSCTEKSFTKKTVLAIPVYGQSLALGEQAERVTDFDSLIKKTNHHVVTENLDEEFGYFSDTPFRQWLKTLVHDKHRAFELSVYGMSEIITDSLTKKNALDSIMICTFPGGLGATGIINLGKGSPAYNKFLSELKRAYKIAQHKRWDFIVPAFCWMQGETDVVAQMPGNYERDLKQFYADFNTDVKTITGQKRDVICICYQTNCLTLSDKFDENSFKSEETLVPQGQLELIKNDSMFMASGPTYPYSFAEERVHIDGVSQKRLGYMAGLSVIRMLGAKQSKGLIPENLSMLGNVVTVKFNVPNPPLVLDTVAVTKAANYGFSVITPGNENILQKIILENDEIKLFCNKDPTGCKIRYAVNGSKHKSGYTHGPRGNLRDSQGDNKSVVILRKAYPLNNWCYQFDMLMQ